MKRIIKSELSSVDQIKAEEVFHYLNPITTIQSL